MNWFGHNESEEHESEEQEKKEEGDDDIKIVINEVGDQIGAVEAEVSEGDTPKEGGRKSILDVMFNPANIGKKAKNHALQHHTVKKKYFSKIMSASLITKSKMELNAHFQVH